MENIEFEVAFDLKAIDCVKEHGDLLYDNILAYVKENDGLSVKVKSALAEEYNDKKVQSLMEVFSKMDKEEIAARYISYDEYNVEVDEAKSCFDKGMMHVVAECEFDMDTLLEDLCPAGN
ncbi:MAG: hypothetical protein K6G88_03160 [Lachnospiraceae bacterium]|nr:hypothetical protein [Lachnospiraceae bacterium]